MTLNGEIKMKARSRTNADNIAAILIQSFINKIEEDGSPVISTESFHVWTDPLLRRQRRFGWYAWVDYENGEQIASSIDCPISYLEKGFNDYEVLPLILNHFTAYVNYGIKPFGSKEEFLEVQEHASSIES